MIETRSDLLISTLNFNPFHGEVLISRESILKASHIRINSKSNLIVNSESKLKAADIVLNGGNCEINNKNDSDSDDDRDHDKAVIKFSAEFKFSGTCKSNPLPTTFKINSSAKPSDTQTYSFNVVGASDANIINWQFDQASESIESVTEKYFAYPGRHLIQAAIINPSGYFRKVGSYLNVSPSRFNRGQIAVFKFFGSQNAPKEIQATIDMRKIILTKSKFNPELYLAEIALDKAGTKNVAIPLFNYSGTFILNLLPEISNPEEYINSKLDKILFLVSNDSFGEGSIAFNEISQFLNVTLRAEISALSDKDKSAFATFLQANLPETLQSGLVTSNARMNTPLFDMLMPSAYAQSTPTSTTYDIQTTQKMKEYTKANIKIVLIGFTTLALGLDVLDSSGKSKIKKLLGAAMILSGAGIIVNQYSIMSRIIDWIYKITDVFRAELDSVFVSSSEGSLKLFGTYIAVDKQLASLNSPLIKGVLHANTEYNKVFSSINAQVGFANNLLASLGINKALPLIPLLTFKQNSFQGLLSPLFATVRLVSSDYGDVILDPVVKTSQKFLLKFQAQQSQNAVIEINYKNTALGVNIVKQVSVKIVAPPKAVIAITNKNNLQVNFDSTGNASTAGLTYFWQFGDGQTSSLKSPFHAYSQAGTYTVSLTVADAFGGNATSQVSVQVAAPYIPPIVFPVTISYSSQNLRLFFIGSGGPFGATFRWSFGDNTSITSSDYTITHDYSSNGIYTVTLEALDQSGNIVGSETLNAVALDPEMKILSSPPSIVTPGSFISYKIQCDIGETLEMENMFVYDFFNNDLTSFGTSDFITECTGLGEQGFGETSSSSIHEVNCRVRNLTETSFYSSMVASGTNISEDPVGVCNYISHIRFYASFSCSVIDPATGEKYKSKQVTADPFDVTFIAPANCPPK